VHASAGVDPSRLFWLGFVRHRHNAVELEWRLSTGAPGRHLALNGHMDVFPVDSTGWTVDPWGGELIDGKYPVSGGGGTVFGNLGRNILRGPDQRDFDIAAIKTTPLTDRVKLIFRWEIFNLLNRPNFAKPSNDVSTPSTFGVISALTVNPRIMQYALKLEF